MNDPAARDATIVRQVLGRNDIDLKAATEVICSRTPTQIQQFKQIYFSLFNSYLEHDIEHYTSGDHKKVTSFSPSTMFSLFRFLDLLVTNVVIYAVLLFLEIEASTKWKFPLL